MDLGLNGVHVLVTGASGGIGLATARLFLKQGAKVSCHYRSNPSTLGALSAEFSAANVQSVQADLTQESEVQRMFDAASGAFGPVQVVIVNHGYWPPEDVPVARMTLAQWNATIATDLTSTFLVLRAFLRGLERASAAARDSAAIVMIGSTAGKFGEAGHADYAASKSAMMYGLTMSLKNEIVKIAPRGRVNCVAPGWVRTPMAASALEDPSVVYQALATTPLRKVAEPEDIASQVVILSSSSVSGHVTGQVILVEGGMEGRLLNKPEDVVV
ncbi:SDR family oxidoreductase [Phanerochaete sordida]|uniref:SDR family oxidoreductase n=1 Tax=Phanerochaete sordida TaxID=48140 RepID=A0A9P3GER3_9APHY|nr:SDR family oxidoreductase [Phanerochaete sordida]